MNIEYKQPQQFQTHNKLTVVCQQERWTFRRPLSALSLKKVTRRLEHIFQNLPPFYSLQYEDLEGDMIDVTCEADFKTLAENVQNQEIVLYANETQQGSLPVFIKGSLSERKEQRKKKVQKYVKKVIQNMMPDLVDQVKNQLAQEKQVEKQQEEVKDVSTRLASLSLDEIKKKKLAIHKDIMCDGCEAFPILGVRYKCAICEDFDLCSECESKSDHQHPFLKIKTQDMAPSVIVAAIGDQPDLRVGRTLRVELPRILKELEEQQLLKDQMSQYNDSVLMPDINLLEQKLEALCETPLCEQSQMTPSCEESQMLIQSQQVVEEKEESHSIWGKNHSEEYTNEDYDNICTLCSIYQGNPDAVIEIYNNLRGLPLEEIVEIMDSEPIQAQIQK